MKIFNFKNILANAKIFFMLIFIVSLISSCASRKEIVYLQDIESITAISEAHYNIPTIRPNDILIINVSTFDMEAAQPFNLVMPARNIMETQNVANRNAQGYTVNPEGTIEFPVLGTLQVGGLTRMELVDKLKKELKVYLKDPIVNITISNYKVTVLGEVARPGTYPINDERITLLEALGMAGDLTIYGKRDNILILREDEGVKTYNRVDITQSDFLHSPYYYLYQNDVIYVEPNQAQVGGSAYNRNTSVYISIASVLISVIVLISRL